MKQILRIFAVVGVILLTALISAGSCDKDDGGGGNKLDANIVVTAANAASAVDATKGTIKLLASKFPADAAGAKGAAMGAVIKGADKYLEAFTVEFKSATAGMILAVDGDKTDIKTLATPKLATLATDTAANKGVHVASDAATGTAAGTLAVGVNVVGVFASSTATDNAFSASTTASKGAQPVLWCVATITGITGTDATAIKLTGGQKAKCYIATLGDSGLGTEATATDWLGQTAATFKKMIKVSFAGIDTGDNTLDKIGLPAATALADFEDGVTAAEMAKIVEKVTAAKTALSQYDIEVVKTLPTAAAK